MAKPTQQPDEPLSCLLIQPTFQASNFWNLTESAATTGAKTVAPPLGLLTVAALLPQTWTFTLVDLNVRNFTDKEWNNADVICTGGMIPQQSGILALIERANRDGKYVVVGGPDPTSQPEIYCNADTCVLGEGEITIPIWLDAWRSGNPCGVFETAEKPDVTLSPIPRFDLVEFSNYLQAGIQISRGCPFNCEFCDIIELYGRVPRSKTVPQVLAELDRIAELGYRGWVDISHDNFIGNKKFVKKLLVGLEDWCRKRKYPFYFTTEASMNLADDEELLDKMQRCDFRFVFMGIETPDPELLANTSSADNTTGGLNFVTTRDRAEIYDDYRHVVGAVYEPGRFMRRVLRTTRMLVPERRQQPSFAEWKKMTKALIRIAWWMTKNPRVRWHYWGNTIRSIFMGMKKFEFCQSHMAAFMHLGKQTARVEVEMQMGIDFSHNIATYPLSTRSLPKALKPLLPVVASTCGTDSN